MSSIEHISVPKGAAQNNGGGVGQLPRRYDVDGIRVLAFALLIVFHVGVTFSPWKVWAYANKVTVDWLQIPLLFFHQWRLPLLFMVSGMGAWFALRRRTGEQFVGERLKRLLIPLIFSSNVIVLFEGYYGALYHEKANSFGWFVLEWLREPGVLFFQTSKVSHLWFVVHLLMYSLVSLPLLIHIKRKPDGKLVRRITRIVEKRGGLLFVLPLSLVLVEWLCKGWASGPIGGYQIPWYFVFFLLGYCLVNAGEPFWRRLEKVRVWALLLAVACSVLFLGVFGLFEESFETGAGYGLLQYGGWTQYEYANTEEAIGAHVIGNLGSIVHSFNAWFWCIAIFAWGARLLNRPSRIIAYCNRAVYTAYIVHQSIMLVTLYYIKDWNMQWAVKLLLLVVVTFAGCLLVFEVVKRNRVTRLLFGIK